ncbi:unnamed protein product [Prorocentrum cordatum]|uniref:EF-hand domain-containing protein n=1 Tax=Prorocentrum cordatum TaxID=2364126 RepID=A0ABN9T2T2_9DINO|nr:unnamed protein product [Polarella glacialis]
MSEGRVVKELIFHHDYHSGRQGPESFDRGLQTGAPRRPEHSPSSAQALELTPAAPEDVPASDRSPSQTRVATPGLASAAFAARGSRPCSGASGARGEEAPRARLPREAAFGTPEPERATPRRVPTPELKARYQGRATDIQAVLERFDPQGTGQVRLEDVPSLVAALHWPPDLGQAACPAPNPSRPCSSTARRLELLRRLQLPLKLELARCARDDKPGARGADFPRGRPPAMQGAGAQKDVSLGLDAPAFELAFRLSLKDCASLACTCSSVVSVFRWAAVSPPPGGALGAACVDEAGARPRPSCGSVQRPAAASAAPPGGRRGTRHGRNTPRPCCSSRFCMRGSCNLPPWLATAAHRALALRAWVLLPPPAAHRRSLRRLSVPSSCRPSPSPLFARRPIR